MKPTPAWLACSLLTGLAVAGTARPAFAETPPGIMTQANASSGTTEVGGAGFQAIEKPKTFQEDTQLTLSAGGLMATGNARSVAVTGVGNLRIRRQANEYSAMVAGNYGRAAVESDESMQTTVENIQGRVRYDRFLSDEWSLFLAESARKDRFQGLDLRLNFDPGVAYYLLDVEKHRLWAELGYDLQYDIRDEDAILASAEPLDKTAVRHSARGFIGYRNDLNEAVRVSTGLEYIQAIVDSENFRLNWQASLISALSTNLSLATTFNLAYDNNPLPGIRKTDTTTSLSLVYTLM